MFSSIVDHVIQYNVSPEDIINLMVEEYREEISHKVNSIVKDLEKGNKPYFQFTMSFEDMVTTIQSNHGEKELNKFLNLIK